MMAQYFYIDDIHENLHVIDTNDFLFIQDAKLTEEGFYDLKIEPKIKLGDIPEEDIYHYYLTQMMPKIVYKGRRE